MAELGRIADPRCADAQALLESKRLPDGGFPLEVLNAPAADRVVTRHSYADWSPSGRRHSNPLVSLTTPGVLRDRTPAQARRIRALRTGG